MSEAGESKATNPGSPTSSKDEDSDSLNFDIREHEIQEEGDRELMETIALELQVQREILEEVKGNGEFKLSDLSKFKVKENGKPTKAAEKLREKVIAGGKKGLSTNEIEGLLDVTNPTATTKMEQMAKAFEDLEVYDPRTQGKKPRYNQPKRLRHKDIAKGKTTPQAVIQEERDKEMIECPECPEGESVTNARKVWRKMDWECPNCGSKIDDSL